MISGNNLWGKNIEQSLLFDSSSDTYKDLPDSLYTMLTNTASSTPDKIGLVDTDGTTYTYEELLIIVDNFSNYLFTRYQVCTSSQVAIMLYNSLNFYISFVALSKLHAISILLPTKYKEVEIQNLIRRTNPSLILCEEEFQDWFSFLNVNTMVSSNYPSSFLTALSSSYNPIEYYPVDLNFPAVIMFTSGTTSESKVVELTNLNMNHAIVSYQKLLAIDPSIKALVGTPLYHITGLVGLLGLVLYSGGTLYLQKFFHASAFLSDVMNYGINFIHASPAVFNMLLEQAPHFPHISTLKTLLCGSSYMPVSKILQLKKWLPHISFHTVYGLTETSSPGTLFPHDCTTSPYLGSSGIPIPGLEVKISDTLGNDLPMDVKGEILIRGTNVLNKYLPPSQGTIDTNHWLHTGDMGYLNKDGYLYIVGRAKSMINRGGEKVWAADIESELYKFPGVLEAVVVGIPNETFGEVPVALIRLDPGYTYSQDDICNKLKCNIASFKVPTQIRFTTTIPLTANMKIDTTSIQQLFTRRTL